MKTGQNITLHTGKSFFSADAKRLLEIQRWAVYFSVVVIIIGALVLTGWQFDIGFLKSPVKDLTAMNPTTAVSFILCGISLLLLMPSEGSKRQSTGKILAVAVILIGLLRFFILLFTPDYGIDTILFNAKLAEDIKGNSSNRMALNSALTFILVGSGLLLLNTETRTKKMPGHFISIFIFFAALISILGYLFRIAYFYGPSNHLPMAMHTAVGFLFISLAILFANPFKGITKEMTSQLSGGFIARFLIPVSIIVPILFGLIFLEAVWYGDLSIELSAGLFALSVILIFLSLTWFIVVILNRKDIQKREADLALLKLNETLEQKIQERTETLDKSEKQYRYLFKNNPMPMWVIDLDDFKFLDVNEMATYQYGYSREEFLSMTALDIRPDSDRDAFRSVNRAYQNSEKNYNRGIWNHVKKDGTIIQVEIIAHEIIFEGTKARLILSHDVTEQKKAEEKIISSESRFRALIENNHDMISLMDAQFNMIYRSPSVYRILGWSFEEYQHIDGTKNIHPDDLENILSMIRDVLTTPGKVIEIAFRTQHKAGHYLWIEGSINNLLADDHIQAVVFNFRDVTTRVESEAALVAAEMNYREIFDKASDGIYVHDIPGGKIIDTNQRAAEITGYTKEEILTIWPNKFITGNSENNPNPAALHLQKAATGQPQLFEWLSRKKDGTYTWLEVNLKKATIAGEERILSFIREINDRKKAQEQVEKLNEELEQKVILRTEQLNRTNQELEAFSYSVSHDLRAPLRAIIGFSTILQEDYISKLDDEAKRITNVIICNTKKMGQLIDDLLTFSRMGRQEILKNEVNSNKVVHEIIEELDKKESRIKKIKWSVHNLPPIKADMNIIRQVWINLISNAVKYSQKVSEPNIEIGASVYDNEVIFFVKDNGVGFDEKYKDKLFRVFQRLHTTEEFEGTGIGLAIVEKIVSRHGGKVWAEAEVDKGACFYFSLPVTVNKEQLI